MSGTGNAYRLAATLCTAAAFCSACAGFGLFSSAPEPEPLPATRPEIRAAIEIERSRLLDLVSEPAEGEDRWSANADTMVVVAERIAQLQAALDELEQTGDANPASPSGDVPRP